MDINFVREYTFEDCKDIKPLPFDFYLPDYNVCIEYQGEQHFKLIDYFGGKEGFEKRLYHDDLKRRYCQRNNIKLLEIPYYDYCELDANYLIELLQLSK